MFRLRRFLKDYKLQLIIGPICKLIEAVFELFIPVITADIIDTGVRNNDVGYVMQKGALMVLLGALGLGFALVCQKSASVASQGFGTKVRSAMFRHINTLSHSELDKLGTPSLITRLTNDVNRLQLAVAMLIRLVIRAPFLVIGALIMAMTIDLKLSLIFFAAALLIGLVLFFVMTRSVPFYKRIQKSLDSVSLISRENLSGNRVIRAFSRQQDDKERFDGCNAELAGTAVRAGRLSALLNPLTYVIAQAAIIAIVWFGAGFVFDGELKTGEIIALVNYMTQILLAMIVVSNLVVIFTNAAASAARVNEVFDTGTSVVEKVEKENTVTEEVKGAPSVEFRDVSFGYTGSGYAVKDLTFTMEKGSTTGIIGGTGSGKSTLVNLIPRFYDASEGQVLVDGIDVKDYSFAQLRGKIGIVPQKAELFSGTIKDNLRFGKRDATDLDIERALKISQSYEFVSKLPEGTDKLITAGGKNLSGGQRQRLTIARALVGQPEILILDDSASALDFATDAALRKALHDETKGMTVIMVSQRVGTVRYADKIIVLDGGEIAGIGAHNDLFRTCGVYREICLSQLRAEEVEN
ncbi:MAG: ABC transporter ATP-binding protein [Clostridia bacterium]|nr:ABC transporter ATP-binding protein [Clostridia bacterium]